ncbi:MAG: hypothetical protein V4507_16050 [Verrucomicrobiota bacterium]
MSARIYMVPNPLGTDEMIPRMREIAGRNLSESGDERIIMELENH